MGPVRDYLCEFCSKLYSSASSLEKHVKTHDTQMHHCSKCAKVFKSKKQLGLHLRRHELIKLSKCKYCGFRTRCRGSLASHFETAHFGKKAFSCKKCKEKFPLAVECKAHEASHNLQFMFVCSFCCKSFSQPLNLSTHITKRHDITKTFITKGISTEIQPFVVSEPKQFDAVIERLHSGRMLYPYCSKQNFLLNFNFRSLMHLLLAKYLRTSKSSRKKKKKASDRKKITVVTSFRKRFKQFLSRLFPNFVFPRVLLDKMVLCMNPRTSSLPLESRVAKSFPNHTMSKSSTQSAVFNQPPCNKDDDDVIVITPPILKPPPVPKFVVQTKPQYTYNPAQYADCRNFLRSCEPKELDAFARELSVVFTMRNYFGSKNPVALNRTVINLVPPTLYPLPLKDKQELFKKYVNANPVLKSCKTLPVNFLKLAKPNIVPSTDEEWHRLCNHNDQSQGDSSKNIASQSNISEIPSANKMLPETQAEVTILSKPSNSKAIIQPISPNLLVGNYPVITVGPSLVNNLHNTASNGGVFFQYLSRANSNISNVKIAPLIRANSNILNANVGPLIRTPTSRQAPVKIYPKPTFHYIVPNQPYPRLTSPSYVLQNNLHNGHNILGTFNLANFSVHAGTSMQNFQPIRPNILSKCVAKPKEQSNMNALSMANLTQLIFPSMHTEKLKQRQVKKPLRKSLSLRLHRLNVKPGIKFVDVSKGSDFWLVNPVRVTPKLKRDQTCAAEIVTISNTNVTLEKAAIISKAQTILSNTGTHNQITAVAAEGRLKTIETITLTEQNDNFDHSVSNDLPQLIVLKKTVSSAKQKRRKATKGNSNVSTHDTKCLKTANSTKNAERIKELDVSAKTAETELITEQKNQLNCSVSNEIPVQQEIVLEATVSSTKRDIRKLSKGNLEIFEVSTHGAKLLKPAEDGKNSKSNKKTRSTIEEATAPVEREDTLLNSMNNSRLPKALRRLRSAQCMARETEVLVKPKEMIGDAETLTLSSAGSKNLEQISEMSRPNCHTLLENVLKDVLDIERGRYIRKARDAKMAAKEKLNTSPSTSLRSIDCNSLGFKRKSESNAVDEQHTPRKISKPNKIVPAVTKINNDTCLQEATVCFPQPTQKKSKLETKATVSLERVVTQSKNSVPVKGKPQQINSQFQVSVDMEPTRKSVEETLAQDIVKKKLRSSLSLSKDVIGTSSSPLKKAKPQKTSTQASAGEPVTANVRLTRSVKSTRKTREKLKKHSQVQLVDRFRTLRKKV